MTGAPVWASHTRASPRLVQATIRLSSGEKFRCVTRPSSGRRWRKAPVAVSRTSAAPRPVITNQRESGLNLASQVEKPFVQIRGSGDLIRTSQSRADNQDSLRDLRQTGGRQMEKRLAPKS